MAKITTINYTCDVCGATFSEHDAEVNKKITTERVPCYMDGGVHTTTDVDMCNKCSSKVRKVIYDHFAEIYDYFGLSVKKKYKDEEE